MSKLAKLPSTYNLLPRLKKTYDLPILKKKFRGELRMTPHGRPRVQSPNVPKRYADSVGTLLERNALKRLKPFNVDLDKFDELADEEQNKLAKEKGFLNMAEEQEKSLVQILNTFKFDSPSYKRFKKFENKLKRIESPELVLREKFLFLFEEAKRELKGPNPDEITPEYFENFDPTNDEEFHYILEKQMYLSMGLSPQNKRYKCSYELLDVLRGFQQTNDLLKVSTIQFKEIFDLSLTIEDLDLADELRIMAGRALYSLGKIDDLSLDKHYNYITSLTDSDQLADAQLMLDRKTVERPMWYQLRALVAIKCGNMDAAEKYVAHIKKLFRVKFVQGDIYVSLIKRYAFVANYERAEFWRKEFEACIEQRGMTRDDFRLPFFSAPPKEKCEYLDKFHPLGGITYLMIIGFYIALEPLNSKVKEMIEFYLRQPNTKPQDLENVILSFRYELSTKIKPHLQKMKNKQAEKYLLTFIDKFRNDHPLVALQEEFKDELLKELAELGGFQSITYIIENTIEQKQKPKAEHFNSLIKALLKRNKVEQAFKVLEAMEASHLVVQNDPQNVQLQNDQLLPSVNGHHYAAFLRYFSKIGDYESFSAVVERFKEIHSEYNAIFLTQILSALSRNDRIAEAFEYVDQILINNIHLQDPDPPTHGYLKLYTIIWKLIKDLSFLNDPVLKSKVEFPDIRYVFMKMIHDNVVPTQNLYDTVLTVFINEKDYYGAVCVLQYLGKIHRTLPHKYSCSKIKKLCKFVKFDDASRKVLPQLDPVRRFEVEHNFNRYQDSFEKIKPKSSSDAFDPFSEAHENPNIMSGEQMRQLEELDDPADRVWRILLHQMMTVVKAQEAYNRDDLIRVHNDFGLVYEADRIFREEEEITRMRREKIKESKKEVKEWQEVKKKQVKELHRRQMELNRN